MNIPNFLKKRQIVLQYFVVLAIILLVPVMLSFFVINAANEITKKQLEENAYQSLVQIKTALDRDLMNIRESVIEAAGSTKLNLYSYQKENPENLYALSELVKLSEFKSIVRDIVITEYIYMESDEIIISEEGKFTPEEYYTYCGFKNMSFEQWSRRLDSVSKGDFADIQYAEFGSTNEKRHVIEYSMSYPIPSFSKGKITVMLDYDKICSLYSGAYKTGNKTFFLTDNSGNVILNCGGRYKFRKRYNDIANGYVIDPEDRQTMLFKVKSDTLKLNYLSAVELSAIKEQERESMKVVTVYLLIAVVLCIVFAVFVARKASNPLVKIYGMIHGESGKDMSIGGLSKEVKRIIDDKKRVEGVVKEQENMLRYQSLVQLVMGGSDSGFGAETKLLSEYFPYKGFVVLMIEADCEQLETDSQLILKYAVKNVSDELLQKLCKAYDIDTDRNKIVYVLNFDELDDDKLYKYLKKITEVIETEFETEINIGIGCRYDKSSDLNISFDEAKQAVEYCKLSGEVVAEYSKISGRDLKYYYSVENENDIIRFLINGDKRSAMATVDKVIEMHKSSSPAALKCLFFHIIATLLNLVNNKSFNIDAKARNQLNIDSLIRCESVPELKKMISGIFDILVECIPDSRSGKKENFKAMLLEYMDKYYCDNGMSLDMVAAQFNVHPTYISHFFKEFIGENFSDYVAKKRIEMAKELLNKDYSLNDIAEMVGYANSAVLIKKFKKVIGITPGEYRRNSN